MNQHISNIGLNKTCFVLIEQEISEEGEEQLTNKNFQGMRGKNANMHMVHVSTEKHCTVNVILNGELRGSESNL